MGYYADGTLTELARRADRLRESLDARDGDISDLVSVVMSDARELVYAVDAYVETTTGKGTQDVRIEAAVEAVKQRVQADQQEAPVLRFPGVAWWGQNSTPGLCQGCQTAKPVHAGYNGGAATGVVACARCIRAAAG
jgi:hypothetical protein